MLLLLSCLLQLLEVRRASVTNVTKRCTQGNDNSKSCCILTNEIHDILLRDFDIHPDLSVVDRIDRVSEL